MGSSVMLVLFIVVGGIILFFIFLYFRSSQPLDHSYFLWCSSWTS